MRHLRHSVFLNERKHTSLDRCYRRMKRQHRSSFRFAFDRFLSVCVDQNRQRRSVGANRGLDYVRDKPPVVWLVEVLELLARELLVLLQIEVTAIVNAFDLLKSERTSEIE